MDYEDFTYEEFFNKIFNEININKKSINKLNDIVINQKKEIEELKNEIEDLKKYNIVNKKENLKQINEKIYSCRIENLEFIDERINEIINNLNVETEEIKEEIKEGIEELKNEIEYLNNNFADLNIEIKEEIKEETNKITKHDNEIIILKQIIQNIQENEIKYIYENIYNLNIEVKENSKTAKQDNEIIELKEIKNNLHFSYLICSYNYHISYLKDIVKLEIDLFTKLINNNILPINFITLQGNDNDVGQYVNVVSHFMNKDDNKEKLKKYFNVNDIKNNKYTFDLANYICFNGTKFKNLTGRFIHNYYGKNTHNKYAIPCFCANGNMRGEIKIQHKIISKNHFYKSLYNVKNELIIENNDFIKMIEMKEDIDEMEEIILDCLERYEFMKTLKTNTIYLTNK